MADPRIHCAALVADGVQWTRGDPAAIFPWWSFTKTVVAACALRLAEEGRLGLDAPLPGRPFTLAQLLRNTAGVPDYGGLRDYHAAVAAGDRPWSRQEVMRRVGVDRLEFAPGESWSYSNVGFLLARERIEASTGGDLGAALESLVLAPLGLGAVRLATTMTDFDAVHWEAVRGYDPGWVYHGCLIGTAAQACRLLHALLAGELLRTESLARMLRVRPIGAAIPGRPWATHGYGLGLMIGTLVDDQGDPAPVVGHSGAGPGCVNAVYHFPGGPRPLTVACFGEGKDEGTTEREALRIARWLGAATMR